MQTPMEERSSSIVDTSLTELAFVFFFILMVIAAWKVAALSEAIDKTQQEAESYKSQLDTKSKISDADTKLRAVYASLFPMKAYDPDDAINQVIQLAQQAKNFSQIKYSDEKLTTTLERALDSHKKLSNLEKSFGVDFPKTLFEFEKLRDYLDGKNIEDITSQLAKLDKKINDLKGQNQNLRNRVSSLGNGLDHPPCWANPVTGEIEYIFDVVISENGVELFAGWPTSRQADALGNMNIASIPGYYESNSNLWKKTTPLYKESVEAKCRHFVRVFDHAQTKDSYKGYLSGIENHFYKFLSREKYHYEKT